MKKELITIAIGVILLFGGAKIAAKGDEIVSKETIQELQNLCENADTIQGKLRGTYEITTVKIANVKTEMYRFSYDFSINGTIYSTTYTTNQTSSKDYIPIWYNKSNPNINSTRNPCIELEKTKKENTIGNSAYYYIGGVLFIIMGIGFVWMSIIKIFRKIFKALKK